MRTAEAILLVGLHVENQCPEEWLRNSRFGSTKSTFEEQNQEKRGTAKKDNPK